MDPLLSSGWEVPTETNDCPSLKIIFSSIPCSLKNLHFHETEWKMRNRAIHTWILDILQSLWQWVVWDSWESIQNRERKVEEEKKEKKLDSTSYHSENSLLGWIDLNVKGKTIKLLNYRRFFFMTSRKKDFSNKTQNVLTIEEKNKLTYLKVRNFSSLQDTTKRVRRKFAEWWTRIIIYHVPRTPTNLQKSIVNSVEEWTLQSLHKI